MLLNPSFKESCQKHYFIYHLYNWLTKSITLYTYFSVPFVQQNHLYTEENGCRAGEMMLVTGAQRQAALKRKTQLSIMS